MFDHYKLCVFVSACGSSSRIDTVLVYDETALGTRTANKLVNLVTNFVNQLDMDSGNMRLSVYPHSCQGQATGNIALNRVSRGTYTLNTETQVHLHTQHNNTQEISMSFFLQFCLRGSKKKLTKTNQQKQDDG